jgi:UDP-glucose:tetrahydrobiopterin glucosyltransferase
LPPCRILFIAPPVGPIGSGEAGGVETHLLQLAPLLVERGHQVGFVAPAGSLAPRGITVYQVAGEAGPSATRAERSARTAVRTGGVLENMWDWALRLQRDYDVVVGINYDWLAFYLTPFFSTPVGHWITICSAIDEVDEMIEKRWREGGLHLALYTGTQAKTFPFLQSGRVHLLYGGVDTDIFSYNSEPQNRLCWAGRISPEKGLEDAIAAAEALDMPLDVCGKMQDSGYWERATRGAREGAIIYHGFLPPVELQKRYAAAGATLATPRWTEAFGNTLIESMACGTPVVAYNQGGPGEIIEHGKNGILAPEGDIQALVQGVREAVKLDRNVVRARAAEFSFARMADRFNNFLVDLRITRK